MKARRQTTKELKWELICSAIEGVFFGTCFGGLIYMLLQGLAI